MRQVLVMLLCWFSVSAHAGAPLPPGDYLGVCDGCTATSVGDVGVMLGCMCGANPRRRVLASIYLLGDACPEGVTFEDGRLACAQPDEGLLFTQPKPVERVVAAPAPPEPQLVTTTETVRQTTASVSSSTTASRAEMDRARLRLAAIGSAPAGPEPLGTRGMTVAQWNESGNAPIRLSPMDCMVADNGMIACMCPTEGAREAPSTDQLVGSPTAWTCGCTAKAGLVCVPES